MKKKSDFNVLMDLSIHTCVCCVYGVCVCVCTVNGIDAEGAKELKEVLKYNTVLTTLYLGSMKQFELISCDAD